MFMTIFTTMFTTRSFARTLAPALLVALDASSTLVAADETAASVEPINVQATDWPWWRGPTHNGIASPRQKPPLRWSETENVVWRAPISGRGHGSPIVVGDQVLLASADEERKTQSILCLDRATGKPVWERQIHSGGFRKMNRRSTHASNTPACDGKRIFINLCNGGAVFTTALDRKGKILWQKKITDYVIHQGYGSSPFLYRDFVLVSADTKRGGVLCALRRTDGEVVWRHDRPKMPNYPSPVVLRVAGREQLIMTGCERVSSFDPATGKSNWEVPGATTECVTTAVTDGAHVFSSGGYPRNHISAVRGDGSGKVVWENSTRVYVPSMLVSESMLYAVADAGVAHCLDSYTGTSRWKGRLGGNFSSSPILVKDRIYASNEAGETVVFLANSRAFKVLARNELGDEVFATPAICGGRIYMRVATRRQGTRQEYLYCLGETTSG